VLTPDRFLADYEASRDWSFIGAPSGIAPTLAFDGRGAYPLEIALAVAEQEPAVGIVRDLWKARHANAPSPLLLVIAYRDGGNWLAALCGPAGDQPPVVSGVSLSQADRLASAALSEPSRHASIRFLLAMLPEIGADLPGLRNQGMFATHELRDGVPHRKDWPELTAEGRPLLAFRGRDLVERLGFTIEEHGTAAFILSAGVQKRAVAVFLDEGEGFDEPALRFGGTSPVSQTLAVADREGLAWAVLTRGRQIRIYSARSDVGVGRKGRAETFVEANLALISDDMAGYLALLFSARSLLPGGMFEEVLDQSRDYSADLSIRLRERVYRDAVPALATALARREGALSLDAIYEQALVVLFRLLFVAYAEDKDLLPYRSNGIYRERALKTLARRLAERRAEGALVFDEHDTGLWDDVTALWRAIDVGNVELGVPAYNGGMFSSDPKVSKVGATLASVELTNDEFGQALTALLVDETSDGTIGPVDFRSLSVREFGTIYEGLLESSLSVAPSDLAVDVRLNYVPAGQGDDVVVHAGSVYFHNSSGARKSTGSYFTKAFAVEHLLDEALEPALDDHVTRVGRFLEEDEEAKAAEALFDFRCVDLAMGSGHFLVAAVDRIEARLSAFLALNPIPHVTAELDRLRAAAYEALGALGEGVEIEHSSLIRRQVARRCVYGVDRNPIAVELARLSVWIHTFVPGLPLGFLDHSLVEGDSLTGIASIDEAVEVLDPGDGTHISLFRESILRVLGQAETALGRLARLADATAREIKDARAAQAEASGEVEPVRNLFNIVVAARLGKASLPTTFDPDAISAHPDLPQATDLARDLHTLHFPIVFPEVFLRDRGGFDCIIGNPPWQEATVEELGFWTLHQPGLKSLDNASQQAEIERLRRQRPDLVRDLARQVVEASLLREVLLAGPYPGMGEGDPDLYKAFAWRFFQLAGPGAAVGVVLPHSIFATKGSAHWRSAVLGSSDVSIDMCRNEREWLFTDVNPGYSIDLVTFRPRVRAGDGRISIAGTFRSEDAFKAGSGDRGVLNVAQLRESDELLCVPALQSTDELRLFAKLIVFPSVGSEVRPDFRVRPTTELHATNDRPFFSSGNDPVYNHLNIGHLRFEPETGAFATVDFEDVCKELQARRVTGSRRSKSPYSEMPAEWIQDDSTLPSRDQRIAFRDVVHASNARKAWCCLVPSGTILTNKAPFLLFPRGELEDQAYLLGVLSSSVVDWFAHRRVVLNLNYFIFNAIPVPVRIDGDPRSERLVTLAASLGVRDGADYGDWSRLAVALESAEEARIEIDALASLLFELDDDVLPLIWDGRNPTRPECEDVRQWREEWSSVGVATPMMNTRR
jgi:hypothetical protein